MADGSATVPTTPLATAPATPATQDATTAPAAPPTPPKVDEQKIVENEIISTKRLNPAVGSRGPRLWGVDPKTDEGKAAITKALDAYCVVTELAQPQTYKYRVSCCECGWQTHQLSLDEGMQLVEAHAVRHLYAQ